MAIWRRLDSPYWTARTLDVLAAIGSGDEPNGARRSRREAHALRAAAGLPPGLRPPTSPTGRALGGHLHLPER
ncbi:hypothetical protein [Streptomyces hypolithicus]